MSSIFIHLAALHTQEPEQLLSYLISFHELRFHWYLPHERYLSSLLDFLIHSEQLFASVELSFVLHSGSFDKPQDNKQVAEANSCRDLLKSSFNRKIWLCNTVTLLKVFSGKKISRKKDWLRLHLSSPSWGWRGCLPAEYSWGLFELTGPQPSSLYLNSSL